MLKEVASVAHLHKKDFYPPDKKPRNYDQQPFTIDGHIDIDVFLRQGNENWSVCKNGCT